ncbi:MAG TPA: hypothetical protein VLM91_06820 [Candidatus Methylomirabilis sp.]|nr:hypothetical protein [Candidatus Methylomirabilis sp.]
MSESKLMSGKVESANQKPVQRSWPRTLAGIGIALFFVDVGVSAAAKGALGQMPVYVAYAAALLLTISAMGGIIQYVSSKGGKSV